MGVISEVLATTFSKANKKVVDNVFKKRVLLDHLKENGGIKLVDGGADVQIPLQTGKSTATWFSGSDTLPVTAEAQLDAAKFDWAFVDTYVTITMEEEYKNRGESQIVDLVKSKVQGAENSLAEAINSAVFVGAGSGSKQINGLQRIVDDTVVVGGIDPATYTWWKSYKNSTAGALTLPMIRTASNTVNNGNGGNNVSIHVTTQVLHEKFESLLATPTPFNQYVGIKSKEAERIGEAGYSALAYAGKPVVFDEACATGEWYLLNPNNYKLYMHKDLNMENSGKIRPANQNVTVQRIVAMLAAVTDRRASLGKLTAKTA